jgi:hypothetical protein
MQPEYVVSTLTFIFFSLISVDHSWRKDRTLRRLAGVDKYFSVTCKVFQGFPRLGRYAVTGYHSDWDHEAVIAIVAANLSSEWGWIVAPLMEILAADAAGFFIAQGKPP